MIYNFYDIIQLLEKELHKTCSSFLKIKYLLPHPIGVFYQEPRYSCFFGSIWNVVEDFISKRLKDATTDILCRIEHI